MVRVWEMYGRNNNYVVLAEDFDEAVTKAQKFDSSCVCGRIAESDTIRILHMLGEPDYAGRKGKIEFVDDAGQLHGTWGSLAVITTKDKFEFIREEEANG